MGGLGTPGQRLSPARGGLFSPDAFIIGGGVSRRSEEFFPYLDTSARIVAAELQNRAGVVGAAWHAVNGLG